MSLSPAERDFFLTQLSGTYFEWGAGWTTVAAVRAGVAVTSVEPMMEWCEKVQKELSAEGLPIFGVEWISPEYGELGACAWPDNEYSRQLWPNYARAWSYAHPDTQVVMIDGRFRVACALLVALSKFKGIILLHDCDRPDYQILFRILHLVSRVEQLAAFTVPEVDSDQILDLLVKHLYDPN